MKKNYNNNRKQTHSGNEGSVFSKCRGFAHSLLFLIIATLCSILGVAEVNAQANIIKFPPSPNAGINATTQTISLSEAKAGVTVYTSQEGTSTPSLSITSAKNLSGTTISSSLYSITSATAVSGYTSPYIYQATFKTTSTGVYTIYASAYFGTNASGTKTITVLNDTEISFTKGNQRLTVAEVRGKDLSVLAPATSNSTGQKSYSVRNSSNRNVTLTNNCLPDNLPAGTYTITVNVAATSTHINASKTCTLTVEKGASSTSATASKQLTLSAGTVSYDLSGLLSAGNYGSDNYTYTMEATDGASISGSTFTATKAGTYTVTITQTEDDAYLESYVSCSISVEREQATLSFEYPEVTLTRIDAKVKDVSTINTITKTGDGAVTYELRYKGDGHINIIPISDGKLPDIGTGTVTLVASLEETSTYSSASASCILNIVRAPSHIDLTQSEFVIDESESFGSPDTPMKYIKDHFIADTSEGSGLFIISNETVVPNAYINARNVKETIYTITQEANTVYEQSTAYFKVLSHGESKIELTTGKKTVWLTNSSVDIDLNSLIFDSNNDLGTYIHYTRGTGNFTWSVESAHKEDGTDATLNTDYTLTDNVLTACTPGKYTVHVVHNGDKCWTACETTLMIQVKQDVFSCANGWVQTGKPFNLDSRVFNYNEDMHITYSCSDANAEVSGSTFCASKPGDYTVTASWAEGFASYPASVATFTITVSNHKHGSGILKWHRDRINGTDGHQVCCYSEQIVPDWDFEAPVYGSFSGYKNARFSINEDDPTTVTLVCGLPINTNYSNINSYGSDEIFLKEKGEEIFDHESPFQQIARGEEYNGVKKYSGVQFVHENRFGLCKSAGVVKRSQNSEFESTGYPGLAEQNLVDVDELVAYYNIKGDLTVPEKVTDPSTGVEYTVTVIGNCAFELSNDGGRYDSDETPVSAMVTGVTLPISIKEIKSRAFAEYHSYLTTDGVNIEAVTNVNFEDLVNLEAIGTEAFYWTNLEVVDLTKCTKLKRLYDVAYEEDEAEEGGIRFSNGSVFSSCRKLRKVNMSGLKNYESGFDWGRYDKSPEIRNRESRTFASCTNLTSLNISDMSGMDVIPPYYCAVDYELTLSGLNMLGCNIKRFENSCFALTKFNDQTLDLRGIVNNDDFIEFMGDSFYETKIGSIVIPNKEVFMKGSAIYDYAASANASIFFINPDVVFPYICQKNGEPFVWGDAVANHQIYVPLANLQIPRTESVEYKNKDILCKLRDSDIIDSYGLKVFPMLTSNTSGNRTMSYFRPLHYGNIQIFNESESRIPADYSGSLLENNDELTAYIASSYSIMDNTVTLSSVKGQAAGTFGKRSSSKIQPGVIIKGTGTTLRSDETGARLYVISGPSRGGSISNPTNFLEGGGTSSRDLTGAPHMTNESTQYISKNGEFHYCTGGTLAPYKAYLNIPDIILTVEDPGYTGNPKPTNAKGISIIFKDFYEEDEQKPTTIEGTAVEDDGNGEWYNLQGMKVKNPHGGIFINKNGKKAMFK